MEMRENNYYTINDALAELNISRATLYSKINSGKIKSEKIGKNRFVYIDDEVRQEHMSIKRSIEQDEQTDKQTVELLKEQLEYFKKQAETLQAQVAEQAHQFAEASNQTAEASQRHDTILMTLTTTIENQQLQLQEGKSVSFLKRIFGMS